MKYGVEYTINGYIEVEANSPTEAMSMIGDKVSEKELLVKSEYWGLNVSPKNVEEIKEENYDN